MQSLTLQSEQAGNATEQPPFIQVNGGQYIRKSVRRQQNNGRDKIPITVREFRSSS